jgi:hypothetical protein
MIKSDFLPYESGTPFDFVVYRRDPTWLNHFFSIKQFDQLIILIKYMRLNPSIRLQEENSWLITMP